MVCKVFPLHVWIDHSMNGGICEVMYVELDVHKKMCYGTVMDEGGRVVRQGKFGNDFESLYGFMDRLEGASVVMESGYCWQPIYDALEEAGHNVKLAHPKELRHCPRRKPTRRTRRSGHTCYDLI